MRIFLTGGSGMLGRHLLVALGLRGHDVLAPPRQDLDLFDGVAVARFIETDKPDLVIHAAGRVGGIAANIADPAGFLRDNIAIGFNVISACANAGVKRLINVGSSCMYPRNREVLSEGDLLTGEFEPTNEGYAIAKIAVAKLAAYIRETKANFRYSTLILPNLYGPYDHFDLTRSHMLPAAIRKVHEAKVSGESDVVIWGDGRARREFMFAPDAAQAIARLLPHHDVLPSFLNVGLGRDHSILDYYQAVVQVVGYSGGFAHDVTRPVGMARKLLDSSQYHAFDATPETPLLEGIELTYKYFLSYKVPHE